MKSLWCMLGWHKWPNVDERHKVTRAPMVTESNGHQTIVERSHFSIMCERCTETMKIHVVRGTLPAVGDELNRQISLKKAGPFPLYVEPK